MHILQARSTFYRIAVWSPWLGAPVIGCPVTIRWYRKSNLAMEIWTWTKKCTVYPTECKPEFSFPFQRMSPFACPSGRATAGGAESSYTTPFHGRTNTRGRPLTTSAQTSPRDGRRDTWILDIDNGSDKMILDFISKYDRFIIIKDHNCHKHLALYCLLSVQFRNKLKQAGTELGQAHTQFQRMFCLICVLNLKRAIYSVWLY